MLVRIVRCKKGLSREAEETAPLLRQILGTIKIPGLSILIGISKYKNLKNNLAF